MNLPAPLQTDISKQTAPRHFSPLAPAPWWLCLPSHWGGHAQTVWSALCSKTHQHTAAVYRRERWATPDHDFIDVDWLSTSPDPACRHTQQPLMVMFHGLEGSSQSHYALAMADWCARNDWAYAVVHFRSCSGDINRAPRVYHMGDYEEADWIIQRMKQYHPGPVVAAGVSLGGNVLLRWAVESQQQAARHLSAIAIICAPLDLVSNAAQMDQGICKWTYTAMFLRTLRQKCEAKIKQYPGLFDIQAARSAKTFAEFDNAVTAPLHGFKNNIDYWTRNSIHASALDNVRIPCLLLNPLNDPFVLASSLPKTTNQEWITYLRPAYGGHLGFAASTFPGNFQAFSHTIGSYLDNFISDQTQKQV